MAVFLFLKLSDSLYGKTKPEHLYFSMRLFINSILFLGLVLAVISVAFKFPPSDSSFATPANHAHQKAKDKAAEIKPYLKQKGFNERIVFLMDLSLHSGKERFFVLDMQQDSIRKSGLVTHGSCNESFLEGRRYSNTAGSGCTSLGKYKIGKSYYGQFGLAWKLHGLDDSNSAAFKRFIVLHSHDCVPDTESPEELCQSLGCPTVSPAFLQYLKPIIDHSSKPILLWLYE